MLYPRELNWGNLSPESDLDCVMMACFIQLEESLVMPIGQLDQGSLVDGRI